MFLILLTFKSDGRIAWGRKTYHKGEYESIAPMQGALAHHLLSNRLGELDALAEELRHIGATSAAHAYTTLGP
jgi:hypothetical protein